MAKRNKLTIPFLFIITASFITACGNKVTYHVTGNGVSTASIVYNNADGNIQEEQVDLPWEVTIDVDEGFDAKLFVTNPISTGEVTCGIWLNDSELGRVTSAINVQCYVLKIRAGQGENPFLNPFKGVPLESTLEHTQKLAAEGNFEKALEYANNAINAAPNFAGCYASRAIVYEKVGDLEAAKADLLKAKDLSNDPDLLNWLEDKLSED